MSQILVSGVEFCHEGVVGLGHVCRLRGFAPVIPLFHCHGCESWVFAPVVLHIELHGCKSGPFAPVVWISGTFTGLQCHLSYKCISL